MTLRAFATSTATSTVTRLGGALSIVAIIATSVVGLHSWADDEATSVGSGTDSSSDSSSDSAHGITG